MASSSARIPATGGSKKASQPDEQRATRERVIQLRAAGVSRHSLLKRVAVLAQLQRNYCNGSLQLLHATPRGEVITMNQVAG